MKIRQLVGEKAGVLEISTLEEMLCHFPWLRDLSPRTLEEAGSLLNVRSPLHTVQEVQTPMHTLEDVPTPVIQLTERSSALAVAAWMAGLSTEPDVKAYRDALVRCDGDTLRAALMATGQDPTEDYVRALEQAVQATSREKTKRKRLEGDVPKLSGPQDLVDLFRQAWATDGVFELSDGSYEFVVGAARRHYSFIPDSPERQASAAVAFYDLARWWGISGVGPSSRVFHIDGKRGAVMRTIRAHQTMTQIRSRSISGPRELLAPSLDCGVLHQWAVLDYVLGNPDRTADHVFHVEMSDINAIEPAAGCLGVLPFGGSGTFVPAYMRCWAPEPWYDLSLEAKWSRWPSTSMMEPRLKSWLMDLSVQALREVCAATGLPSDPAVLRLEKLKADAQNDSFDLAIRNAWLVAAQLP